MERESTKDFKKIVVSMPKTLHKQIVKEQYDVFKKENRHVSVASLIRSALHETYSNKKEE